MPINERHLQALLVLANSRREQDTKRGHVTTLACSFVAANLQAILGQEPHDPEMVMDEERITSTLERGW